MELGTPVFGPTVLSLVSARIHRLKFLAAGIVLAMGAVPANAAIDRTESDNPWMASSMALIDAARPHCPPPAFEVRTMSRPGFASFTRHVADDMELYASLALSLGDHASAELPGLMQPAASPALTFLSEETTTDMSLIESMSAAPHPVVSMKALFEAETPGVAFAAFTLPQDASTPLFATLAPTVALGRNEEFVPPARETVALARAAS
jgi:hypothetical protein